MRNDPAFTRRDFLAGSAVGLGWLLTPAALRAAILGVPTNNPVAHLKLVWTDSLKWASAIDVTQVPGKDIAEQLANAQALVAGQGGGVVCFPPGVYRFADSIQLKDGVVLRGADPAPVTSAQDEKYTLRTRFEFPQYEAVCEGEGTPILRAFKGIYLENPGTASNCGVVNLDINRGHIHLHEAEEHRCGGNRLVFGCILRNAAAADPAIPNPKFNQPPWQRYTQRFSAAIDVKSHRNALVANNRIPRSGDDNFTMNGYVLQGRKREELRLDGVVFDYDNRPGIYVNHFGIGGAGGQGPDGTPETHPHGFRQGMVIRDNYLFNTGRCAIGFCGDGVRCQNNVIRFVKDVWRPTVTGTAVTSGSATNDNRAVEMRGWRWTVDGNDYEVYRNKCQDRIYDINDGEGLMHEDHVNSTVKDSVLTHNRGNTYLSIFHTAGIDGLRVEGNDIRTHWGPKGIAAIYVVASRHKQNQPIRNVQIVNNTTAGTGIQIGGSPAENCVVKGNRHVGDPPARLVNHANAVLEGNTGYDVVNG